MKKKERVYRRSYTSLKKKPRSVTTRLADTFPLADNPMVADRSTSINDRKLGRVLTTKASLDRGLWESIYWEKTLAFWLHTSWLCWATIMGLQRASDWLFNRSMPMNFWVHIWGRPPAFFNLGMIVTWWRRWSMLVRIALRGKTLLLGSGSFTKAIHQQCEVSVRWWKIKDGPFGC